MILCRTKEAKQPLYLEGGSVAVYSLEELSYYLFNNIFIIDNSFISSSLMEFIRESVGEEKLADFIDELRSKNAGLAEIIVAILKYVDYYSIAEIEGLREVLKTLNSQNTPERLKTRGDSYLVNQYYNNAIKCYEQILVLPKENDLPNDFLAAVFHNIGVAYGRLFLYSQAADAFDKAYMLGKNEDSLKMKLAAIRLHKGEDIVERDDTTEDEYIVKRELETLMDNARYSEEYIELKEIDSLKDDGKLTEYHKKVETVLDKWKKAYNKHTS